MTTGRLFIVATPIGNLEDITLRALKTLKSVDLIAAEDTRHSQKLLNHYNINTPLISLHDYNENKKLRSILTKLLQGSQLAIISDAGTPLISDPGYHLIKAAQEQGVTIVPIPGACAAIAAITASGLPTDRFIFEGFLPIKSQLRSKRLQELAIENRTMIFYEAPHRLLATVAEMINVFGQERRAVVAKELTKIFEQLSSGTLLEIQNWLQNKAENQLGEFVLIVKGITIDHKTNLKITPEAIKTLTLLASHLPPKDAVLLASQITKVNKKLLYNYFFVTNN